MKKYFKILTVNFFEQVAFPSLVIGSVLISFIALFFLVTIYIYVYSYNDQQATGITLAVAVWGILIYNLFRKLDFEIIFRKISSEVKTGQIEIAVIKPYNYLLYHLMVALGSGLWHGIVFLIAGISLLLLLVGFPVWHFSLGWLLLVIITLVLGYLLGALLYAWGGLASFWLVEARPVGWFLSKTGMILGGGFVPLALFPPFLRSVAEYSPFGAIYFTTQAFVPGFTERAIEIILIQIGWIFVLGLLLNLTFKRSIKILSINGG